MFSYSRHYVRHTRILPELHVGFAGFLGLFEELTFLLRISLYQPDYTMFVACNESDKA